MQVFLKLAVLDYFDQVFYLNNVARLGDKYNSGEKRYQRVDKNKYHGVKWRSL